MLWGFHSPFRLFFFFFFQTFFFGLSVGNQKYNFHLKKNFIITITFTSKWPLGSLKLPTMNERNMNGFNEECVRVRNIIAPGVADLFIYFERKRKKDKTYNLKIILMASHCQFKTSVHCKLLCFPITISDFRIKKSDSECTNAHISGMSDW